MRPNLVLMVKMPVAGAVKSRLAAAIGPVEAARFYRAALARLIRRMGRDPRWRTILAVAPDNALDARIWPAWLDRIGQGGGDLGARMQRLLHCLPPGPVMIVGSDIPELGPAHIAAAARRLARHDVVFGPAEDGGYWLVGARRRPTVPILFSGVRWSTPHALSDTLDNCGGLSVGYADRLADVDTRDDWRRWRRRLG